jgi:hypothetical protein
MSKFPPSLSIMPGKSDAQLQEERILQQLRRAVSNLPAKSEEPDPEDAARYLHSTFLMVTVFVARKPKRLGCASPTSVAKQLKQIATGAATLARRMKSADRNVYEALRDAAEDREIAKEEWLRLKSLLETMHDRAKQAARTADAVLKVRPQTKGKAGRPVDQVADNVTIAAAEIYERRTGKRATRVVSRETGEPEGEFYTFLASVYLALSITANPDASIQRLDAELKKIRKKPISCM